MTTICRLGPRDWVLHLGGAHGIRKAGGIEMSMVGHPSRVGVGYLVFVGRLRWTALGSRFEGRV